MSYTVRSLHHARSSVFGEIEQSENMSNVKIYCRIRPPTVVAESKSIGRGAQKEYASLRNKSRSASKNRSCIASPFSKFFPSNLTGHQASVIQTARDSTNSLRSPSQRSAQRSTTRSIPPLDGKLHPDKVYSMFTTRNPSSLVICTEDGLEGRIINEHITDSSDLQYLQQEQSRSLLVTSKGTSASFQFEFDSVFNESTRQDKFYSQTVKPVVKSFIEGESGSVIIFGPTNGGKTFSLKGKAGADRGLVPRAIEDIFSIIKAANNEDLDGFYEQVSDNDQENMGQMSNRQYSFNDQTFLKVSIYQILSDKILDLLSGSKQKKVYIDHEIDQRTQEVVGRLRNISEKVVLKQEDFYKILQQAFQSRRMESVHSPSTHDLRKKSHMVISLTLMQRSHGRLTESSHLNFVELSGSEQAVSNEHQFVNATVRSFVTKSFNGLSSQLLKSALRKKGQGAGEGEVTLVECLRKTMTHRSNIVLICNVNPAPNHYEHSLPAVKFCAKIRDSIVKRLNQSQKRQGEFSQRHTQVGGSLTQEVKKIISELKEEMANRQIQELREELTPQDYNQWSHGQLTKIQKIRTLLDENPSSITQSDQYQLLLEIK